MDEFTELGRYKLYAVNKSENHVKDFQIDINQKDAYKKLQRREEEFNQINKILNEHQFSLVKKKLRLDEFLRGKHDDQYLMQSAQEFKTSIQNQLD